MYNQKQYSWRLVFKQIGSGFLFVTMFLTPSIVFADFSVNKNGSNQTVTTGVTTQLTFSTELYDTRNEFDTSTSRFTPTIPGNYLVTANVLGTPNVANGTLSVLLGKNGSIIYVGSSARVVSSADVTATISVIVPMNGTTDYLDASVYMNGVTVGGSTLHTYFTGAYIPSASSTVVTISDFNRDLFYGFLIFFILLFFVIWFFKK